MLRISYSIDGGHKKVEAHLLNRGLLYYIHNFLHICRVAMLLVMELLIRRGVRMKLRF